MDNYYESNVQRLIKFHLYMLEKHNYLDCAVYEYYKHCIQELRVHDN